MSTEKQTDTLPKKAMKTEPGRIVDADVEVSGPFRNPQAQALANAAKNGVLFCEKCEVDQHAQTASQDS